MTDSLLAGLFRTLDLAVIERLPNAGFHLVTPAPDWLTAVFDAAPAGSQSALAGAMPFLDSFLEQAEAAWKEGDAIADSGPFAAVVAGEELLLSATALTLEERTLLVIGRLSGLADARPVLQRAREHELEREQIIRNISAARSPAAAVQQGVEQLLRTPLTGDQQAVVARLRQASTDLQTAMAALPTHQVRQRRQARS